ncbi:hypothetical protein HCQ60_000708, partial [Escherichia coli]|nr:hypothetical protein [Escherichia coli]
MKGKSALTLLLAGIFSCGTCQATGAEVTSESVFKEVDVFIKIFESWRKKLPAISGPVNLYIPTRFKDKYLEVESYFVDKSIWNVHITFHDDKRFVFFTDQFIAEFSPQEFVDNCEQYLINNHCFSPDKVNEICEQARHYLVEKMFETH